MRNFLLPLDGLERTVVRVWRTSGRRPGTINAYLLTVRCYRRYCANRKLQELDELTLAGSRAFAAAYARRHRCSRASMANASRSALRAWAIALAQLGRSVPRWTAPAAKPVLLPIVQQYVDYRRGHAGVAAATVHHEIEVAGSFLQFLEHRHRRVSHVRLADVDDFVGHLGRRMTPKTVSGWCSVLRMFFRFLRSIGSVQGDLASAIQSPKVLLCDRPPKTLTKQELHRLLASISRGHSSGRRAFAVLLLMISYGLGAAEVSALDLDDVDWRAGTIRVRRPKTGATTLLPLSPAVARAVVAYLRRGRPPTASSRALFVQRAMPHVRMSPSAVRHCVRDHARAAGVRGGIGAHVLRHTHASLQIEGGASAKVVGDILGHRDPSSTSAYVRVALGRLRALSLPVPR
jgi:integrase/recombinase XerD